MNFVAYFDESGTHQGSEAIALAGYISTPSMWEAFEREWNSILDEFQIDFFHMAEFAHSTQQFKGWPEEKRRACFKKLLEAINKHVIGSVGTVIPGEVYRRVFDSRADEFVGGAYGLAANTIFLILGEIMDFTGVRGQIAYVFEDGSEGAGKILKNFQLNIKDPGNREHFRLLSLKFENKRKFVPLQAADILAYELYQQLPRQLKIEDRPPRLFSLESLRKVPCDWGYLDESQLLKWSTILAVRAGLDESELENTPLPEGVNKPTTCISIADFQARWKWRQHFIGRAEPPKVTTI